MKMKMNIFSFDTFSPLFFSQKSVLFFPFFCHHFFSPKSVFENLSLFLFYLFFERDALTATIQIGDKDVPKLLEQYNLFSLKAQSYWENRYPCGKNSGWIHYRILSDDELDDVLRFIAVKKTPIN